MQKLLEKLDLINVKGYRYEAKLSGGRASATLLYFKNNNYYVMKLLIAPRNEYELKRFKEESDALENIYTNLGKFQFEKTIPILEIPFTQHKDLPVFYFIMEKAEGKRLDKLIDEYPLPWSWKDSIEMIFRITSALKYVELRYIHRDLHPKNIIIQNNKKYSAYDKMYKEPGIKILDFGCTKDSFNYQFGLWEDDSFRIPGAISSWSPELLLNPNEVDHRHDSWAIGVLLYRLLTNKYPYPAQSFGDIINYQDNIKFTFDEIEKKNLPLTVNLLVRYCLSLKKTERFSVTQIVEACDDILHSNLYYLPKDSIKKYFLNGASLFRCDVCRTEEISQRILKCPVCGSLTDDENITPMLYHVE